VNAALEEEMKEIHALSIKKALTPEQWKQQQEPEKLVGGRARDR
jgi:acid stress-induced BolA-like protein IbaG/YrbA